jgi:hypothetical protein
LRQNSDHYLLLRYCRSTLRDLRKLVNKVQEDEFLKEQNYLHSYLYRCRERNSLLDQITRILKEYNGIAEIPSSSGYQIRSEEIQILKKFLLELLLLTEHLSIQLAALEERE